MGFRSGQVNVNAVEGEVMRELERRFPPEFRNRIDDVVLFAPLTRDEVRQIAQMYVTAIVETVERRNKEVTVDREAVEVIVDEGHSLAYGARFLKRVIDDRIKLPISEQWPASQRFHVRVQDGKVVVDATGPRLLVPSRQLAYGT
jgi:ATP-dependent Clp protease ATP-binding subunit ClpA